MNEAKISDIFLSYQGEGPYLGMKQLFIRFYGCSFNCAYCDTKPFSYNTFTKESLLDKISEYKESYHSISLTGGEPLEQVDFLEEFLTLLKQSHQKSIYFETNGILHEELKKIIDSVDIISMDIKLPSSTKKNAFWDEHKRFLEIAKSKDVLVKVIITDQTNLEDVVKARDILKDIDRKIPFILQPVDPIENIKRPSAETLTRFKRELDKDIKNVEIIPQWH
ncbi:MAG: 7-carboxy-7-deazaguanine synthase QueE, partial [Candidatus Omnitrophica bacterium]|nr:7-carboxy-7-deazaguanine synthase QueE [Candidatus Omnitrophota bacterium]